jgi:predicted nuclease of predicted toxin-antitoxin system
MLRTGGVDCDHVRDHGLQAETDEVILAFAREHGLVVVSEDTDFGELLARQRAAAPSFVLLRTNGPMPPEEHAALLLSVIPRVLDELVAGAVVVVGRDRIRVRELPLLPRLPEQRDK